MSEAKRDYKLGYGKPPLGRRFQKGQSGNPRGPRRKDMSALLIAMPRSTVNCARSPSARRSTVFPKGKHDDQVDSTAQMLDWFKRGGQEPQDWMWQLYKRAQARGPQPTRPEPLSVMARRLGVLRSWY